MQRKNKSYTVEITETAWEMLIFHARFLANVSAVAANRLIDNFVEITASLAEMPGSAHGWNMMRSLFKNTGNCCLVSTI